MSAYASLPGSFLPPFFAFGGSSPTKASSESITNAQPAYHNRDERACVVGTQLQNMTLDSTHPKNNENCAHLPSLRTDGYQPNSKALESRGVTDFDSAKSTRTASTSPASEIIIAINNARVDTVQLIQNLTTRGSYIARRTASFISRSSDNGGAVAESFSDTPSDVRSLHSKPSLCYEDSDSEDDDMSFYDYDDKFTNDEGDDDIFTEEQSVSSKSSQDEDAIQFDLSITFQGRNYTATRAFSTFVQLRNDLLLDESVPSTVSIPELPTLNNEKYEHNSSTIGIHALAGVARSGFALLHATAKMYCPHMEIWLRHVVAAVPSSPILNRFLWEPLASSKASWHPDDSSESCDGVDLLNDHEGKGSSSHAKPPHSRGKIRSNNQNSTLKYRLKAFNASLSSITELEESS